MELYIDLSKGKINTSRLVKRPIQVKGKNGKVFTRMQWVDPKTGQPVTKTHGSPESEHNTKKTQKEHINDHVKSMSREDKYHHLAKHDIDWKRNAHPAIDHKNAVEAIKNHLYKNPHLAGAEHLDKDDTRTPEGDDKVNDWVSKYTKDRDKMYKLMHHAGVVDSSDDPKNNPEWGPKPEGNGSAPIRHMKNSMAFKKHLKENPHKMDEYDAHPELGTGDAPKPSAKVAGKPKPVVKSKAQEGGNTIDGVIKSMSSSELYALANRLGITDRDPRTIPEYGPKPGGNGSAPIRHMRVMMAIKKEVEKDPSILNLGENGELSDDEKERLNNRGKDEKLKDRVEDFLDGAGKELKLKWADEHKDHEHMKSRIKSDTEIIDNMHKVSALKKIIMDNPGLMGKGAMKDEHDLQELKNLRIGNKVMQKILLNVVGLKGIGDVKSEERGVEWSFGVASFARIEEDDDGNMILSVVDMGKDGEEFNEHQFPLEQVKKYMDELKAGSKSGTIESKEIPLHKKPFPDIWKSLNGDFEYNYTPEVGEVLKKSISEAWIASGRRNSLFAIAKHSDGNAETMEKVVTKLGITPTGNSNIPTTTDEWRKIAYGHMIDKEKTKHANEYIQRWKGAMFGGDMVDTWVLHESAKNWQPEERAKARKELIRGNIHLPDGNDGQDKDDRMVKLVHHTHKSLEFVPFDLMTDMVAEGCKFDFTGLDSAGKPHSGCYFSDGTNTVHMGSNYFSDNSVLDSTHPTDHIPKPTQLGNGATRYHSPFSETMAHEFAHATDHYLSDKNGYVNWTNTKYSGSDPNIVKTSYNNTVERSNPNKYLGTAKNGKVPYVFHKDEWMSSYEGRVYHSAYYRPDASTVVGKDHNAREFTDIGWKTHDTMRGLEHWSENSARYAGAFHMYEKWQKENMNDEMTMSSWSKKMHDDFLSMGYGDDSNAGTRHDGDLGSVKLKSYKADASKAMRENPMEGYGYQYHKMSQIHPELYGAMHEIYGRGDFVGSKPGSMEESHNNGDYTRKSELVIYLEGS